MGNSSLSDNADIVMGQSPPGETCNTVGIGLPLINGPTEYGPHHPTPVQFTTDARKRARPGDVLFCVRGSTTGRMNWADREYAVGRGVAAIRHKKKPELQPFVRAVIEFGLPGLLIQATGSTFPNVSADQLACLWWPPLKEDEQRAIACILGTLDGKIELNRGMNETLEAMARALFKSWFVDFDPVRAKAEDRDTGLPKEIADLFPARFVESELGEIPDGWQVKTIGDVVERLSVGKKYEQKTVVATGKVPVLDQGKSGLIGYHNAEPGIIASVDRPIAVFANHTCYMRLVYFSFSAIQNVLPFTGKGVDTVWAFFATKGKQSFLEYKGHWPDFIIHHIAVPEQGLTVEFFKTVHPLLKRIWTNEQETRNLAAIRDALLPKLFSGEVRVTDAERFAEVIA